MAHTLLCGRRHHNAYNPEETFLQDFLKNSKYLDLLNFSKNFLVYYERLCKCFLVSLSRTNNYLYIVNNPLLMNTTSDVETLLQDFLGFQNF